MANNATPSAPVAGLVLLPCPFCGAPAKEFGWRDHYGCSDETCGAYAANLTRPHWNRRHSALGTREAFLEARLGAVVGWLESNQPDVFRRGLWDALNDDQRSALAAAQGTEQVKP